MSTKRSELRRDPAAPRVAGALALLLAACGGDPAPGDAMVLREVVQELLVGEGDAQAWSVASARPDAPPRVGILTPSISWRVDGGDAPALVMPPPCAVELAIDPAHGPVVLRASAGIDHAAAGTPGIGGVGFRVLVNGEVVFDETIGLPADDKGKANAWRHVGGEPGLVLAAGARVRLETHVPSAVRAGADGGQAATTPVQAEATGNPGSVPLVDAGFGRLWLERHTAREREAATRERPNLVLVVMDTQRRDRVSAQGYARPTTPNVDRLAARGMLFEGAYATSSWTWPSTASLLTGLLPQRHGVLDYDSCYLGNALETLPEALQRAGYTTAAFSGNPLITPDKNFGQGFERFDGVRRFEKSDVFVPEALAWLAAHRAVRFFLYLQLVEPHMEYLPSNAARAALMGPEPVDLPAETANDQIERYAAALFKGEGRTESGFDAERVVPSDHQRTIGELYDASVRTGDEWVGRVLDALAELGLEETTVVAFTSDHGEELFEHEFFEHGHSLFAELTGVPLVLAGPGVPAGRRIATPISNRHLAPTLARLAGAELRDVDDAQDLLAAFGAHPIFLSTRHGWWDGWKDQPIHGIVKDGFVLHHAPTAGAWGAAVPSPGGVSRLYDLRSDPLELIDVASSHPDVVRALRSELEQRFEREARARISDPIPAGAATEEMLRGVGYLGDDE